MELTRREIFRLVVAGAAGTATAAACAPQPEALATAEADIEVGDAIRQALECEAWVDEGGRPWIRVFAGAQFQPVASSTMQLDCLPYDRAFYRARLGHFALERGASACFDTLVSRSPHYEYIRDLCEQDVLHALAGASGRSART